jgi:hypothetical protein
MAIDRAALGLRRHRTRVVSLVDRTGHDNRHGRIAYWMGYTAGLIFLLACLLAGLFFVGRGVSRRIKRLLSR